jgi:hypothetical protein
MIVGPDLAGFRARAEAAIDAYFIAHASGRYAAKVAEARVVASGGSSALLTAEASARGVTATALATTILAKHASVYEAAELARVQAKLAVRSATTHAAIVSVLTTAGIALGA